MQLGVAFDHRLDLGNREGVQLLDPGHRDALGGLPGFVGHQVDIYLAAAEHQARHMRGALVVQRVGDHGLEVPLAQLGERRGRTRMAEQALGRHDHQRARVVLEQRGLAAQQMEVLGRGGAVGDADVVVGGELQEALEACAGVLGPLALVAVRQQEHQRGRLGPLGAA